MLNKNLIKSKKSFDFLSTIPEPEELDVSHIPPYTKPSNDSLLLDFAKRSNSKFVMSTSTISSCLMQIFFMFQNFSNPNERNVSNKLWGVSGKYMVSQRKPTTCILRRVADPIYRKDNTSNEPSIGVWALDSDTTPLNPESEILMFLGKILERMYTMEVDDFDSLLVKSKQDLSKGLVLEEDYHRFMKVNDDICLRSQIDCKSDLEDGSSIVYEIKTRAVAPIRYDMQYYKSFLDYRIDRITGFHSSFEREFYDLVRGAFLKYYFQLRIGNFLKL